MNVKFAYKNEFSFKGSFPVNEYFSGFFFNFFYNNMNICCQLLHNHCKEKKRDALRAVVQQDSSDRYVWEPRPLIRTINKWSDALIKPVTPSQKIPLHDWHNRINKYLFRWKMSQYLALFDVCSLELCRFYFCCLRRQIMAIYSMLFIIKTMTFIFFIQFFRDEAFRCNLQPRRMLFFEEIVHSHKVHGLEESREESSITWMMRRRRRIGIFKFSFKWSKESKFNFVNVNDFSRRRKNCWFLLRNLIALF